MTLRTSTLLVDEKGVPYPIERTGNKPHVVVKQDTGDEFLVKEEPSDLLKQILEQLKMMNMQLSLLTDEEMEVR